MPRDASRSGSRSRLDASVPHVHSMSDGPQVVRSNAQRVPAGVIDVVPFGRQSVAVCEIPGIPMRGSRDPCCVEVSVSTGIGLIP